MDQKVYEGYKRTLSRSSSSNSDAETSTLVDQKTTPKKATTSTRTRAKSTGARITRKSTVSKPNIAMFIDVDNVGISRENLLEIIFYVNGKYQIEQCKLYGFSDDTLPGVQDIANEYNMVTVGKMKFKQTGVNCLDSRLLIDAYECALNNRQKIDMIFVWCYPCDLTELFEKIVNLGVNTSTIENNLFDCKNKFVSQTFKLYSPYNFTLDQVSYGKVQNQPSQITPNEKIDQPVQNAENVSDKVPERPKSFLDENAVPPVLPRRTIIERSNPNTRKKEEDQTEQQETNQTDAKPSSLVEGIARKLNLQMPSDEETTDETEEPEQNTHANSDLLMALLKQSGYGNLFEDEKALKYEDTIGDL